jgi:protein gp37
MNKQGKGGIEYLDFTWSIVTGCNHPCKDEYCYAAKIAKRFGGHYSDLTEGNISTSTWKDGEKIHVLDEPMYRYDNDGKM